VSPTRAFVWILMLMMVVACTAPASRSGAGQSADSAGQPAPYKRIATAITGEPRTLSSTLAELTPGAGVRGLGEVEQLIHVGLANVGDRGVLTPRLAEDVPTIENGLWTLLPDGRMETTWRIRPNARWHDGTPFTTDDLAFTAAIGQDPELPLLRRRLGYSAIESVDVVDPRTITVRWKTPFIEADSLFTHLLAMPMPKHLLGATYAENKASLLELPYWNQQFVGAGPYRLREWVQGSHLVLDAFASYAPGRAKIDEIEVKFIPDPTTRMSNVLGGAVDMTMGLGLSINQGVQLRDQWQDGRLTVSLVNARALHPQLLNPRPAAISEVQFRRALIRAIDRQELVDTLQLGYSEVPDSFLNPTEREFEPTKAAAVHYGYDPRLASQMVADIGYTRGGDGMLRDPSGERLSLQIVSVISGEDNEKAMLSVADYWQRIGITTEMLPIPLQRQNDREYRSTIPGFDLAGGGGGDTSYLERLRSSQAPTPENNFVGRNKVRYMSAELDALIDRFFVTVPWDARMDALRPIVHHISDQVVIIQLFYTANPTMIANRIKNVSESLATAAMVSWNAHEWDVETRPSR
jgi:peptide/nickel transport system substrate-binding protein